MGGLCRWIRVLPACSPAFCIFFYFIVSTGVTHVEVNTCHPKRSAYLFNIIDFIQIAEAGQKHRNTMTSLRSERATFPSYNKPPRKQIFESNYLDSGAAEIVARLIKVVSESEDPELADFWLLARFARFVKLASGTPARRNDRHSTLFPVHSSGRTSVATRTWKEIKGN